jgi:8-oxo-dGTP diphosphatase
MPTLGVEAAILVDHKIFLTKRQDYPVWCLPGGGVESGESVEEAIVREVLEETGMMVAVQRVVGIYSRPFWRNGGAVNIVLQCEHLYGKPVTTDEVSEFGFFELNSLPVGVLPWVEPMISDAFAGSQPPVLRTFQYRWQDKMLSLTDKVATETLIALLIESQY